MKKDKALIFVVDDDRYTLARARKTLQKALNCNVLTFSSGEECLEHISDKPDVIVLDYYMNGKIPDAMNGIQVLKKIRSFSNDVKVVMLSAQDRIDVAVDSIKYGANEYISKSETAFIRLENTIKNLINSILWKRESNKFEMWNYVFGFLFLLMVIAEIIIYYRVMK